MLPADHHITFMNAAPRSFERAAPVQPWLAALLCLSLLGHPSMTFADDCATCAGDKIKLKGEIIIYGKTQASITFKRRDPKTATWKTIYTKEAGSSNDWDGQFSGTPFVIPIEIERTGLTSPGGVIHSVIELSPQSENGQAVPAMFYCTLGGGKGCASVSMGAGAGTGIYAEGGAGWYDPYLDQWFEGGLEGWHAFSPPFALNKAPRLFDEDDAQYDPGATSKPGGQSSPEPDAPNEFEPVPFVVGQTISLGRTTDADMIADDPGLPIGHVGFTLDLSASNQVTRADFQADLEPEHAALLDTVVDGQDVPTQFHSSETLIILSDITVGMVDGVRAEIYPAAGATFQNGSYTPAGSPQAVVDYLPASTTIGSASVPGVAITETRNAKESTYEYYSLPVPGGGGVFKEIRDGQISTQEETPVLDGSQNLTGKHVEITRGTKVSGGSEVVTERRIETFELLSSGMEPAVEVEDPNGAEVTTTYVRFDVPGTPIHDREQVRWSTDGTWQRNVYDEESGALKATYRTWKVPFASLAAVRDMPEEELLQKSEALRITEEFVAESIRPKKTVQEFTGGVLTNTRITTQTYAMDFETGLPVVETRTVSYLKDGTLAGVSRSARYGNDERQDRTAYSVSPDGGMTHYEYENSLPPGVGETLPRRKTIVTQGTVDHPQGLPRQHTRTVTVSNSDGLIEETLEVSLGGGGFLPVQTRTAERQTTPTVTETQYLDGVIVGTSTQVSSTLVENTDEVGVVSKTTYDAHGEVATTTERATGVNDFVITYGMVAGTGDTYLRTVTRPGESYATTGAYTVYNLQGQQIETFDQGHARRRMYEHTTTASGQVVSEKPHGATNPSIVTTYLPDGSLASITGPAVVAEYHQHTVDPVTGYRISTVHYGTENSVRWQRSITDGAGRMVRTERPAPTGGGFVEESRFYNTRGQLTKVVRTGSESAPTLYEYDDAGQLFRQGVDLNNNGKLDVYSNEPITEQTQGYEQLHGTWWQVSRTRTYFEDGGPKCRESLTRRELGKGPLGMVQSIGAPGVTTTVTTTINRTNKQRVTTTTRSDSNLSAVRTETNGFLVSETSHTIPGGAFMTYGYDTKHRLIQASRLTDGGVGTNWLVTAYTYDDADRMLAEETDDGFVDNTYEYYPSTAGEQAGRLAKKTAKPTRAYMDPSWIRYAYNDQGQQTHEWGIGSYPVMYEYNSLGEKVAMKTYTTANPSLWNSDTTTIPTAFTTSTGATSTTEWEHHPSTGQIAAKEDASGQRTEYSYNANGQLYQREWARGVVTTYAYDAMGWLFSTSYSDGTPAVSLTYHRDGSLKTQSDGSGLHTHTPAPTTGLPALEAVSGSGALLEGLVIERGYDAMGRPVSLLARNAGTALGPVGALAPGISMGYTMRGQLGSVNSGNLQATYAYNPNSGLDGLGKVITRKVAGASSGLVSSDRHHAARGHYQSKHDWSAFHQQREMVTPSAAYGGGHLRIVGNNPPNALNNDANWVYAFNARGEVNEGRRYDNVAEAPYADPATTTPKLLAGLDTGYTYDDIGNRVQQVYGGRAQPGTLAADGGTVDYTVNALNQYTELENSRYLYALGSAKSTVGVEVNSAAAVARTGSSPYGPTPVDYDLPFRQGGNYSARITAPGTDAAWMPVEVEAIQASPAVTLTQSGHRYHPPAVEQPTYDVDGNLTGDGRWDYVWDGENRLIQMTTTTAAVTAGVPSRRLSFAYDGNSRRVRKLVEHWDGVGMAWVSKSDTRFVYDGWNMIVELEILSTAKDAPHGASGPFVRRSYVWGTDLSGSPQGAGGVGGLLVMRRHGRGAMPMESYWPTWDLNGNVIGMTQAATTAPLASRSTTKYAVYEYDPFGSPLRVSEPEEDLNPFRFSTKYTDAETGDVYYGYRILRPAWGRWLNRDPIEEEGGLNIYALLANNALDSIDLLGEGPIADAAVQRTIKKFTSSPLAKTTGIVDTAITLGSLTGYDEIVGSAWGGAGVYSRWTKTIRFPSASPDDDVALHELVHVYNHQKTGIGSLPFASSRANDEGMAYHLQNIYAAADVLLDFEKNLKRESGDCARMLNYSEKQWKGFWQNFGVNRNYPFKVKISLGLPRDVNMTDELNLKSHLKLNLPCGKMVSVLNPIAGACCIKFSCKESGPKSDEDGQAIIYTGIKLPFYQR